MQDTPHNGTKLKNLLLATLKNPEKLPFGRYFITIEHLQYLVDNFSKDKHQLTNTTLNPIDRQQFSSALRMWDNSVINLLDEHVKDSQAAVLFLKIMRNFIFCFMGPKMPPLDRLRDVWYSIFVILLWKKYVHEQPGLQLKDNFLSKYCYNCLELNAHSYSCNDNLSKRIESIWMFYAMDIQQPSMRKFLSTNKIFYIDVFNGGKL